MHSVKRLILPAVLIGACLIGVAARADQRDPRLDGLFSRLKQTKDPAEAEKLENRIWDIWNESGDAEVDKMFLAGRMALNEGDFDVALEAFSQVIVAAPGFAEGWNKRATVYFLLGANPESLRDIGHALALEPRHFGAMAGLGYVEQNLDNDIAALKAAETALAINPHLSDMAELVAELRHKRRGNGI